MSEAGVGTTAGIEIPGTRDDYQETDRSVASDGFESGGLATPPNTPISTSLTPNNSLLLSKSWFAEQFHRFAAISVSRQFVQISDTCR